jgi:hypothetical protein
MISGEGHQAVKALALQSTYRERIMTRIKNSETLSTVNHSYAVQ